MLKFIYYIDILIISFLILQCIIYYIVYNKFYTINKFINNSNFLLLLLSSSFLILSKEFFYFNTSFYTVIINTNILEHFIYRFTFL